LEQAEVGTLRPAIPSLTVRDAEMRKQIADLYVGQIAGKRRREKAVWGCLERIGFTGSCRSAVSRAAAARLYILIECARSAS
jgi:hypothetical protein